MMRQFLCLLMAGLMAIPVFGWTRSGVTLADTIEISGKKLVLNGMALRKKFIFKVYVAGLYLPQKEKDPGKILKADDMRCTMMHFLRTVEAEKMNEAWYDGLKANTPGYSSDLKKQFDSLAGMMEEMKEGDRLVFTYIPGQGTEVKVRDKVKGTIPGKIFADALFSCWIGPEPGPGESFKEDLLGIE